MTILARRLLVGIPTLALLPLVVFMLLDLSPGDATHTILDVSASDETVAQMQQELGLDRSFAERYLAYVGGLLRGDLGASARSGIPVAREIATRLPYTLLLVGASVALGVVAGGALGAIAALKQRTKWDVLITAFISVTTAIPTFWLALLLVGLFALRLRWLPVFGADGLRYLILPAICTAFALIPGVTRLTRNSLLETLSADFVVTARAKGLRGLVVLLRHVTPVAAIPVITYVEMQIAHLFTSVVVMEMIFNWPGLGGLAVSAAFDRDPLLLQGTTLAIAALTFAVLFLGDLLVLYLDPRISRQAA